MRRLCGEPQPNDYVDATPARDKLLEAAKTLTWRQIAQISDLSHPTLLRISGGHSQTIRRGTADRIARANFAAAPTKAPVPVAFARHILYTLAALGYPITFTAAQARCPRSDIYEAANVLPSTATRLGELFADLRWTPVEEHPAYGHAISKHSASLARGCAQRAGYRTPDWYDDDMRLLDDKEHHLLCRTRKRQARAEQYLEVLRMSINGATCNTIGEKLGFDEVIAYRIRKEAGLTFVQSDFAGYLIPVRSCRPMVKKIERAVEAWLAGEDPYEALYAIGLMTGRHWIWDRKPNKQEAKAS